MQPGRLGETECWCSVGASLPEQLATACDSRELTVRSEMLRNSLANPLPVVGCGLPDAPQFEFLLHPHAGNSVVSVDIATGVLRFLDDLRSDCLPVSGAIAPAAWKPSGELL